MYFSRHVFFKVFAQICCYLSKLRDILGKFISQKNLVMAANRLRFSKYLFPQNLYIQDRTLGSGKPKKFSISRGSLVVLKWQKIHVISNCNIQQNLQFTFHAAEAYSEPFQMANTDFFVKKINALQLLTSLAKNSSSDVLQGSEYASFQLTININKPYMAKMNHRETQLNKCIRGGEMDFKVEGPWNTEKYCRPLWQADKENFEFQTLQSG